MKRFITLLFFITSFVVLSAKVVPVEACYIPESAKNLIVNHFKDPVIAKATFNTKTKAYNIVLKDGTKFTFDYFGEWLSIDGNKSPLPLLVVPRRVRGKAATQYGYDTKIIKMTKDKSGICAKLLNGKVVSVECKCEHHKVEK